MEFRTCRAPFLLKLSPSNTYIFYIQGTYFISFFQNVMVLITESFSCMLKVHLVWISPNRKPVHFPLETINYFWKILHVFRILVEGFYLLTLLNSLTNWRYVGLVSRSRFHEKLPVTPPTFRGTDITVPAALVPQGTVTFLWCHPGNPLFTTWGGGGRGGALSCDVVWPNAWNQCL